MNFRRFIILLLLALPALTYAQKVERLDLRPGFREFKFKTHKESYIGMFGMRKTEQYGWPDIVEVYSANYKVRIGNTRTDSVHVFFLGNRLVRTTVFLEDTLSLDYLQKYFGVYEALEVMSDEETMTKLNNSRGGYTYREHRMWKADMVRMEDVEMYMKTKGGVTRRHCLDLYLNDFRDMMDVFNN